MEKNYIEITLITIIKLNNNLSLSTGIIVNVFILRYFHNLSNFIKIIFFLIFLYYIDLVKILQMQVFKF